MLMAGNMDQIFDVPSWDDAIFQSSSCQLPEEGEWSSKEELSYTGCFRKHCIKKNI